jgi:hypothetical protein
MLAATGSGLYFLFLLYSDVRDFTGTPTFDAINCFGAGNDSGYDLRGFGEEAAWFSQGSKE